jgi:hypothetical protein
MPSVWEYLAFYLGFKKKQSDIERQRLSLSDQDNFTIPPEMQISHDYHFPESGTLTVDIEPMNDTPVWVLLVNQKNLARLQAGNRFEPEIDTVVADPQQLQVHLPGDNYRLMIENDHRSLRAVGYMELEFRAD